MSPAIFKYKNITVRIYPLDHDPVHVHAESKGKYEIRIIFKMREGKVNGVVYENIAGREKFTPAMMRDVKKLVKVFGQNMADDFITVVQKNKKVHDVIVISKL